MNAGYALQQPIVNMKKKILSIAILLCMLCSMSVPAFGAEMAKESAPAKAKSVQPYSLFDSAMDISLNASYSGNMTEEHHMDCYRFTLSRSGEINLKGTIYMPWTGITVFDSAGTKVWGDGFYWNNTTQQTALNETIHLTSGTYYIYFDSSKHTGAYNFQLDYTSANESFDEFNGGSNNSIHTANSIDVNSLYRGQIASNDDRDYYRFTLDESGEINLKGTLYISYVGISIFDSAGENIWGDNFSWNDTTQQTALNEIIHLTSGTYYICFNQKLNYTGTYNFQLNYTSANESFRETTGGTNNDIPSANGISLGKLYYGQIANNDEKDFYRFSVPSSGKISIQMNGYTNLTMFLYDADGNEIKSWSGDINSNTGNFDMDKIITLEQSGVYYLAVQQRYWNSRGNYNFSISSYTPVIHVPSSFQKIQDDYSFALEAYVSDSSSELSYMTSNPKVVTVSSYGTVYIEGPGTATVTVWVTGTSIIKKVKITVRPSRVSIYRVTKGKRALKAEWYRNDKVSGYQVIAATNKSFTKGRKIATIGRNSTTAKTIKGLKKNTRYYVKVRAYKTVGKTKLYGAYSQVRTVKVK